MRARLSVVVVGGGISGLAAAWELSGSAAGPSEATPRIEIIESTSRLGGSLDTLTFAGRTIDAGADGVLARRPEAIQLMGELALVDEIVPVAASGAWIYLGGTLNPVPAGAVLGVPTSRASLAPLRSLSSRARRAAWRDEHVARALSVGDDASIGTIVRAKLGDELAHDIVEPMIGGIQAGRIDDLSAAAVFPALLEAARRGGSLMKSLRPTSAPRGAVDPEVATFVTLRGGVGSLATVLAERLCERGVVITRSSPVSALRRVASTFYRWEVDTATTTTPANAVIVATPPVVAGQLLAPYGDALGALGRIDSASAAMVTLCVDSGDVTLPPSGTGVLVPLGTAFGDDTFLVTAITFLDRKWPHLARAGQVLVRVHVGRIDDTRSSTMDDAALIARVRAELAVLLRRWPRSGDAVVVRWPRGLPQYRVGHLALVGAARAAAARLDLQLAGNAYDGVGVPASIASGRAAARGALAVLDAP